MKNENTEKTPLKLRLLLLLPMLIALLIVIVLMLAAIRLLLPTGSLLSIVDGSSMDVTLHDGQYMFQDGKDSARGDIVICYQPDEEGKILIKRIVGMPGDRLTITEAGVYIDDEALTEAYLTPEARQGTYLEHKHYNQMQLRDGEYFVMGDNRTVSLDSRSFGAVESGNMLYKVSDKPGLPFFLAIGKLLLIAIAAFVLDDLLDKLLTKLFCRKFPQLIPLVESKKNKA